MSCGEGYIGKPEVMKEVISERGLFVECVSTVAHASLQVNFEIILSEQPGFKANLCVAALVEKP